MALRGAQAWGPKFGVGDYLEFILCKPAIHRHQDPYAHMIIARSFSAHTAPGCPTQCVPSFPINDVLAVPVSPPAVPCPSIVSNPTFVGNFSAQ
jgi:hypothetical protein